MFHLDWNSLFHAFLVFLAGYFGTKHGTENGNGNNFHK